MADAPANAARTKKKAPVTLEERRARQRAYVKKSYYRQQSTVHALKQQVRELEDEYQRLESAVARSDTRQAATHGTRRRSAQENERSGSADSASARAAAGEAEATALTDAYAQLTLLKEALRREHRVLVDAASEHDRFQRQLGLWLEDESDPSDPRVSATGNGSNPQLSRARRHPPPPVPVVTKPFTVSECQQLAAKCYADVRAFLQSNPFESSGANVFGWRDERRVLDGGRRFDFSLKKFFYGHTAAELSLGGWRLNSTVRLRDFYARSIDMDVHVLQQVDADNVIMFRVIRSADGRLADNTLFLTTRFRVDTGFVILFRSLDHEGRIDVDLTFKHWSEREQSGEDEERLPRMEQRWRGLLTWVLFDEAGENGEHCLFHFGGMVPQNAPAWMLEILLVALRWENLVVGPVFTIS